MTNMPKRPTAKIQFVRSRIFFHSHCDFLHLITGQTNSFDVVCIFLLLATSTAQDKVMFSPSSRTSSLSSHSNTFPPLAQQTWGHKEVGRKKISCSSSAGNSERFLALFVMGGGKFFRNFSTIPILLESISSTSSSFLVTSFRPLKCPPSWVTCW